MVGARNVISVETESAGHNAQVGFGGVDVTTQGPLSTVNDRAAFELSHEGVVVQATATGKGIVTLSAPASPAVEIVEDVVEPSAITKVGLSWAGLEHFYVGEDTSLRAEAWVGDELVLSPVCEWSLDPADGPVQIASANRDQVVLRASSPATATLRCRIGASSMSAPVQFE
jgi:hypothetical protein